MNWGRFLLTIAFCLAASPAQAQQPPATPAADGPAVEVAAVGLTLTAVPAVLYEQVHSPQFQPGYGVVVEQVSPKSAAYQAGLRRHDVLLSFQKTKVRDQVHFARLLRAAPPDRELPLVVLRGGKEVTLQAALSTKLLAAAELAEPAKGLIKPDGPPAVHVVAKPLDGGKMAITFTYYSATSKLEHLTCTGTLDQIQEQVQAPSVQRQMPGPVRDLVDATLKRIRTLHMQP
jgi:hypothetical protein